MNDLAIPLNGVDVLHAHFAEWVRFLDAKGLELEAQVAKLEARKVKTGWSDTASSPAPQDTPGRAGFLELAFGKQATQSKQDQPIPTASPEPTAPPDAASPEESTQETSEQSEPTQDPSQEAGDAPDIGIVSPTVEPPEPERAEILPTPPEDDELV